MPPNWLNEPSKSTSIYRHGPRIRRKIGRQHPRPSLLKFFLKRRGPTGTLTMDRSEVWWADLPPPVGRRPVLILTRSSAVAVRNQVVVAQVTTKVHNLPVEVRLTKTDGMPQNCAINCDTLLTVPKDRLISRIIRLTSAKMDEVNKALR